MNDPYKTLGLERGASVDDIKKAYKKLALEHHPDRNLGDNTAEERFKEISEAYNLIKDGNWSPERQQMGFNPFDMNSVFRDFGFGFEFDNMFGGRQAKRKRSGNIRVTLEEANNGCKKNITVTENTSCLKCKGAGFELGDKYCPQCNGGGKIRISQGIMSVIQDCRHCRGFGREIKAMCPECQGTGKKVNVQNLEIVIPEGTAHGQKVYPMADLEITIVYTQHPEFMLMDNMVDILSKVKVNLFDAMLGGNVKVNTLQGQKLLKVPPGTQPNAVLRIKSAGMKNHFGATGDHLVELSIELPKTLTKEQEDLLLKFKELVENKGENNG